MMRPDTGMHTAQRRCCRARAAVHGHRDAAVVHGHGSTASAHGHVGTASAVVNGHGGSASAHGHIGTASVQGHGGSASVAGSAVWAFMRPCTSARVSTCAHAVARCHTFRHYACMHACTHVPMCPFTRTPCTARTQHVQRAPMSAGVPHESIAAHQAGKLKIRLAGGGGGSGAGGASQLRCKASEQGRT
eukprot:350660-Chlamydomonas_euryale.AAC.8